MSSSYSARPILDKRRKKSDNTYPLKIRVIVARDFFDISLDYSFDEKYWIEDTCQLSPNYKEVIESNHKNNKIQNIKRFNNFVFKKRSEILEKLQTLHDDGLLEVMSLKEVRQSINPKNSKVSVLALAEERVKELKETKHFGNARVYETLRRSLNTYLDKKDIPLRQVNFQFLKNYENWYMARDGNSYNGLAVNMRTLRAIFNRAIKDKQIPKDFYPFALYKIKEEETRKRAISLDALLKFAQFESSIPLLQKFKNQFLISFCLMGCSYIDLAFLKMGNIHNSRVEYKRQKTGKLHSIKLFPMLLDLLKPYMVGKGKDEYIMDIITAIDPEKQFEEIRRKLKRFNEGIREIATILEIENDITSYCSRHTWGTVLKKLGVSTSIISEGYGHTTEETTQIYLDSFGNEIIDESHQIIIQKLKERMG